MSDQNISEKLVESVTNILKKTIIFEKTERIQGIFIGLTICTSVFGLFTIYNTYKSVTNENKLNNIENLVNENASVPRIYYKILLDCQNNIYNMSQLQNKMNIKMKDMNEKMKDMNENVGSLIKDNIE
jgi:hypothetical protein